MEGLLFGWILPRSKAFMVFIFFRDGFFQATARNKELFGESLYFFFTRDEIRSLCLKEVEGLVRESKETLL
jgi:hypothetical protein